jgi:putative flippase GtrA
MLLTMELSESGGARTRIVDTLRLRFGRLMTELAKFGTVGLMALVIDVGLFNLLRFAGPDGEGVLIDKPLTAKLLSVIVAITFSYFANRHWTYGDRGRTGFRREYVLFLVVNGIATLIALLTLWTSHYALGLTSPLADNISANVIGLVLGTMFRFWAYRTYVFPASDAVDSADETTAAPPVAASTAD